MKMSQHLIPIPLSKRDDLSVLELENLEAYHSNLKLSLPTSQRELQEDSRMTAVPMMVPPNQCTL
jgi:hypothetical protein